VDVPEGCKPDGCVGVGFRNAVVSTGWAVSFTKQYSNLVGPH